MSETAEVNGPSGKKYVLRYVSSVEYDDIQKRATINSAPLIDELTMKVFPDGRTQPRKREEGLTIGEQIAASALAQMEVQKLLLLRTLVSVDGVEANQKNFHQLVEGKDRPTLETFAYKMNRIEVEDAKKSGEPSLEEKTTGSETKE